MAAAPPTAKVSSVDRASTLNEKARINVIKIEILNTLTLYSRICFACLKKVSTLISKSRKSKKFTKKFLSFLDVT